MAEGAGEFVPKEKARFYRMARRSATESAAVLDVCQRLGLLDEKRNDAGRVLLLEVVAMLVHLIRNLGDEARARAGARERYGLASWHWR